MNMRTNKQEKLARTFMIICVVTGLMALAVCIAAVIMKQYLMAGIMVIVAVGQIFNYRQWKGKLR